MSAASTLHDTHRSFLGIPDDNATQVAAPQPEDPEQMAPNMALAHPDLADLSPENADIAQNAGQKPVRRARGYVACRGSEAIPQAAAAIHAAHRSAPDAQHGGHDESPDADADSATRTAGRRAVNLLIL